MDKSRFFPNPAFHDPTLVVNLQTTPYETWADLSEQLIQRLSKHRGSSSTGSLYVGDLGFIYLQLRMSDLMEESSQKHALLRNALTSAEQIVESIPPRHRFRRVSLLESPYVGSKVLTTVLLNKLGNRDQALAAANELISGLDHVCQKLPPSQCEVLYGRAGAMQAISFLRQELGIETLGSETLVRLAKAVVMQGQQTSAQTPGSLPLLWKWHDSYYLGAAHGVVGILHTLLSLSKSEWKAVDSSGSVWETVRETILQLDDYCFASGNLDSSVKPQSNQRVDRLVHWCHGATGHVLLLVKAARIFDDERFLTPANEVANVVWERGLLRKGVGLCHGISGSAYALLSLAPHDPIFRKKAEYFAQCAVQQLDDLELVPDQPYSLYEGMGGLCALLIDLASTKTELRFPLYI